MNPLTCHGRRRAWSAAAAALFGLQALCAQAQAWSGAGGDNLWSTPGNWVGGVIPSSANTTLVTFGAAGPGIAGAKRDWRESRRYCV